jgi:uracil-DNA glycosylase
MFGMFLRFKKDLGFLIMDSNQIQLEASWKNWLTSEFQKPSMIKLKEFLRRESAAGKTIYPKGSDLFRALNSTPFEKVEVVILGQDPYHAPNQAHGLCFSVQAGVRIPPSLKNIYKELQIDLGIPPSANGYLQSWADQGVLLLNTVLTVEEGKAASHAKRGWEEFTDRIVELLNEKRDHLVFMLWGSHAQAKGRSVDRDRHLVLEAPHPSPLSAHRGFLGCGHFSKANEYLRAHGKKPIDWELPPLGEMTTSALTRRPSTECSAPY